MNESFLYESIIYGTNFFNETHIKEIKKVEYGKYIEIDLNKFEFKEKKYWDFYLNSNIRNIDEASDIIERSIIETLENIEKDKKIFGIGVSGGLDSRILLYYAKKINFNVKPFIISLKNHTEYF
ncbi:MAG: hypothetical protein PWP54_1512 [Thermosipho sp. (in: thermotogales)]|nr:hypothetical protein [Thermosipho sp. (in: thermotogales)]MDN5325257.1 hypothetical protein [Thermosipho sp. (in: thermotogales)]